MKTTSKELIDKRRQYIISFVENNQKPNLQYCPELILRNTGIAKKHGGAYISYYNPLTGQNFINYNPVEGKCGYKEIREGSRSVVLNIGGPRTIARFNYVRFIESIDSSLSMIELSQVDIHTHKIDRTLNADKRDWEFAGKRYYLFKDDFTPYDSTGKYYESSDGRFYNKFLLRWLEETRYFSTHGGNGTEWRKFAYNDGVYKEGSNNNNLNYAYNIANYYKTMIPRNASAQTKKAHEIANTSTLTSIDQLKEKYKTFTIIKKTNNNGSYSYDATRYPETYWFFEKVGDIRYLRGFKRDSYELRRMINSSPLFATAPDGSGLIVDSDFSNEKVRVIIDAKGKIKISQYNGTSYNTVNSSSIYNAIGYGKPMIFNVEDVKADSLLGPHFVEEDDKNEIASLIHSLRHPLYKQLNDKGYTNLTSYIETCGITPALRDMFNVTEKAGNINDMFKVNDYQLQKLNAKCNGGYYGNFKAKPVLALTKVINGKDDIRDLKDAETDQYFAFFDTLLDHNNYAPQSLLPSNLAEKGPINYWYRNNKEWSERDRKEGQKLFEAYQKDPEILTFYTQAIETYKRISYSSRPPYSVFNTDMYTKESLIKLCNDLVSFI